MDTKEALVKIQKKFNTGSKYLGLWDPKLCEMEVEGDYYYPDNTRYKGEFRNGVFHGVGRISMPPPCNFSLIGDFENGKLVKLNDLMFGDNLRLDQFDEFNTINLKTWQYCEEDRRYATELKDGLWPVGSKKANLSIHKPTRLVNEGQYDAEEGVFNPETGIVTRIPAPFNHTRFLQCPDEREWVKRYCRYGGDVFANSPISQIGLPIHEDVPKILKFNIESAEIEDSGENCICDNRTKRKGYFGHFIEKLLTEKNKDMEGKSDDTNDGNYSKSSSGHADSLSELSLLETLNEANLKLNKSISHALPHEFNSSEARHKYELYKSSSYLIAPARLLSNETLVTFEDSS